jgi:hypothetical protein
VSGPGIWSINTFTDRGVVATVASATAAAAVVMAAAAAAAMVVVVVVAALVGLIAKGGGMGDVDADDLLGFLSDMIGIGNGEGTNIDTGLKRGFGNTDGTDIDTGLEHGFGNADVTTIDTGLEHGFGNADVTTIDTGLEHGFGNAGVTTIDIGLEHGFGGDDGRGTGGPPPDTIAAVGEHNRAAAVAVAEENDLAKCINGGKLIVAAISAKQHRRIQGWRSSLVLLNI